MVKKRIEELTGTEILAKAILTSDFIIILPEGATLKKEYIDKLRELNIKEVYVKDEQPVTEEVKILKTDMEEKIKDKVKEILEHHTYQHNDELMELSIAADNIIASIVDEQEVIEQVFDIKQRNADIYEHSLSLCTLSILTALKINLPQEIVHDIGVGCLLHDIGLRYLTIPYENQNLSELSTDDMKEYMKHPVYGYSALKNETWISEASKCLILYHHERKDGSGYPLHATNYPVAIEIVNICDAFDELICGIGCEKIKVYQAVEYLKNFKNAKFNGTIVDVFLEFTAVYPAGSIVLTTEGETAVVVRQNKEFPDRPVLKIVSDKNGQKMEGEVIKDMIKIHNLFIEKVID